MNKPRPYLYHTIWNGSLNLGDTPGVFNTSAFVGLILQIPVNVTHIPANRLYVELMLYTSDVEIFNSKVHYVYLDWIAGQPFNAPNRADRRLGYNPEYTGISSAKNSNPRIGAR